MDYLRFTFIGIFSLLGMTLNAEWVLPSHAFSSSGKAHAPQVASDISGNAIAVWEDVDLSDQHVILSSFFNAGTLVWDAPIFVSNSGGDYEDAPTIQMDESGFAVTVFRDTSIPAIQASAYKNGDWIPLSAFMDQGLLSKPLFILKGSKGVIAWISSVNGIQAVAYENGAFKAIQTVDAQTSSITTSIDLAMNKEGKAVLAWTDNQGQILYSIFDNSQWSSPKHATNKPGATALNVGIDSRNEEEQEITLVFQRDNKVKFKRFAKGKWSVKAETISAEKKTCTTPKITYGSDGNVCAIWSEGSNLESRTYNGKEWSKETTVITSIDSSSEYLIVNDISENNFVLFTLNNANSYELKSLFYRKGLDWSEPVLITSSITPLKKPAIALSSRVHTAFAVWEKGDGTDTFGSFSPLAVPPNPPTIFESVLKKDRYLAQTDRIHILKWNQTEDPTTVSYKIKKGSTLLFECPVYGVHRLDLHNRENKIHTYSISAVNALGVEGAPKTTVTK